MFVDSERVMHTWAYKRATNMVNRKMRDTTLLNQSEKLTDMIMNRFDIACRGNAKAIAENAIIKIVVSWK